MILYFTDRNLNVIGKASTSLPGGYGIINDSKVEDIETMAVSLECDVLYEDSPQKVENYTTPGNYVLRKCKKDKDILFQIIEAEKDDDAGTWHIYCEDAGLDLLNEVALKTNNAKNLTVTQAVNNTIIGSGYEIGINKVTDNTTKLCEFSEQTRSERLKEIAELFEVELDYRFTLSEDGHTVNHKYIDIYKKRGSNNGVFLRKGRDIDNITVTKSIENLATSLYAYGDSDNSGTPVTLDGYKYDDGDFVVAAQTFDDRDGDGKADTGYCLQSRKALEKWGRSVNGTKRHITKLYNLNTVSQKALFEGALKELKSVCKIAVNYECSITNTEKEVALGDTVNVVDEKSKLFLSARILKIETSEVDRTKTLTLGDYLIKQSGISEQTRQNITQIITTVIGNKVQEMTAEEVRRICT